MVCDGVGGEKMILDDDGRVVVDLVGGEWMVFDGVGGREDDCSWREEVCS
jgi:hypothetical protein